MMHDLPILMLVLILIVVIKRSFFPAKRRLRRVSYRLAGRGESAPADDRIDGYWPDAGYEYGRDEVEEGTRSSERERTGEAGAENRAGGRHENGSGLSENDARAVESYRSAALRGSPEGQVNLGYVYCLGLGVKKNYRQARRWFEQAVASGDTRGKAGLAWLLATCPDDRIRDGERAIELLGPVVDGGERDPVLLDILASACAEAGLFPDAVRFVTEAMERVDRTSERALYEQMAGRLRCYRRGWAWHEPPEETDSEERPDDEEEKRSRRASKVSPKDRRTTPTKPTKADMRDKPAQSSRKGKKTEKPVQQAGPKEKPTSKAAAAPPSRPAKKVKAASLPGAEEAKAMLAALEKPAAVPEKPAAPQKREVVPEKPVVVAKTPVAAPEEVPSAPSRPAAVPQKPVVLSENPAPLPEKPAVPPKAVSPSGKRIRSADMAGLPEKPPQRQATPGKAAVKTALPLDRQEALDVSNLIVGALMSGKYEEMYAAMSGTYRDAVSEDAIGTMIEQMFAVSGGRVVAAELAGDEAGFYREAGGGEIAKHTFRYSVLTEDKKETHPLFVEVVREGGGPACADFYYAAS